MLTVRNFSAFLLLAGPSLAAPRNVWFPADAKQLASTVSTPSQAVAAPVLKARDYTSNGILFVTTTIVVTVQPGLSPAAQTPAPAAPQASSAPAVSAPAPVASSPLGAASPIASTPAAIPSMQHSTMVTSASPAPASQVAPSPATSPTQAQAAASAAAVSSSGSSLTEDIILQIMPNAKSCASPGPTGSNCRTAAQAVAPLAAGFAKYGINSKGAQAANLALIALESGQLVYDQKQFPSPVPGQGTRNMMSPTFVQMYAEALYPTQAAATSDPAALLKLVLDDNDSFASASWFLADKCPAVLKQFESDPNGAWTAYLGSGCIGTTDSQDREAFWTAAKAAFGIN